MPIKPENSNTEKEHYVMASARRQQELLAQISELESDLVKEQRNMQSLICKANALAFMASLGAWLKGP